LVALWPYVDESGDECMSPGEDDAKGGGDVAPVARATPIVARSYRSLISSFSSAALLYAAGTTGAATGGRDEEPYEEGPTAWS
jgi:hypothetical protein